MKGLYIIIAHIRDGKFASDHYPVIVEVAVRWTFPGHSPPLTS